METVTITVTAETASMLATMMLEDQMWAVYEAASTTQRSARQAWIDDRDDDDTRDAFVQAMIDQSNALDNWEASHLAARQGH